MTYADNQDQQIDKAIQNYFWGTYEADEEKIRAAFHEKAVISGFFDGAYKEWNLNEFIEAVKSRPSASSQKEAFSKKIVSIKRKDNIAVVHALAPAYGNEFTDFISLIKTGNGWKIRHKSFTNSVAD